MGIPENIRALRAKRKLSQPKLADKAGVSQQLISQLERGENLTTKYLPQIARALQVTIREIDPNFGTETVSGTATGDAVAELAGIFARLDGHPEWQEYLLDQARRLEQRVRVIEDRQPPKGVGSE